MEKRTSSQPTLLNDLDEPSTKDMSNQLSSGYRITVKNAELLDSDGKMARKNKGVNAGRKKNDAKKK